MNKQQTKFAALTLLKIEQLGEQSGEYFLIGHTELSTSTHQKALNLIDALELVCGMTFNEAWDQYKMHWDFGKNRAFERDFKV